MLKTDQRARCLLAPQPGWLCYRGLAGAHWFVCERSALINSELFFGNTFRTKNSRERGMPGSERVSREMPVRIGLLASRQNDLRKSAIARTRSPTRETRALPGKKRTAPTCMPTLLLRKRTSCIHIRQLKRAPLHEFTRNELRQLRALKTPVGVQRFLDSLPYHLADTAWSPRKVLQTKTAHCLEGAIFAAAALRVLGFPPLLWDLEAVNDTDHVLAIFKVRGCGGAVAKSNFSGCRYREPVYRTLRELAMSYFNIYFNLRGERTLRRYSQPVYLTRFDDRNW